MDHTNKARHVGTQHFDQPDIGFIKGRQFALICFVLFIDHLNGSNDVTFVVFDRHGQNRPCPKSSALIDMSIKPIVLIGIFNVYDFACHDAISYNGSIQGSLDHAIDTGSNPTPNRLLLRFGAFVQHPQGGSLFGQGRARQQRIEPKLGKAEEAEKLVSC
jgi:hypothetical protein